LNQVVDDVEKVIAHVLQQQEQEKFTIGTTIPTSTEFTALQRLEESKRVLEKLALIIHDVRNEHFHERHWLKLESKLECSFTLEEEEKDQQIATSTRTKRKYLMLPVRDLLNVGAIIHASEIHEISEEAKAEAAILKSYQDVASMWETKEIETLFKRDREGREIAVLSSENTTEIASLLEES
jgi:hypothetical protein